MSLDIKEVIESFCATSKEAKFYLRRPWCNTGTEEIFATNKHICIVVPKKLTPKQFYKQTFQLTRKFPDTTSWFNKSITYMTIDNNQIDELLNENTLEFEFEEIRVTCKTCNGRGSNPIYCSRCKEWHSCSCCDGAGGIYKNTGRKYACRQTVKYHDGFLDLHYLNKLKNAMDTLGGKWEEGFSSDGFYYFKNDIGVRVVIAAIIKKGINNEQ